ncbi:MAG: RNA polymerase sigma factor [Saprospiraceae bacterium]|nr:RNA polymerase sigma factor [Saprospiraceae bacterium]
MQQALHGVDIRSRDIGRMLDQFGDLVMTLSMRILNDRMMAEEATQDTFIKVYKGLHEFREEASLKTWIYRIAYRTAIDYARKKKRHSVLTEIDHKIEAGYEDSDVHNEIQVNERTSCLQQAIDCLPPDQAALISLYYLEEKNVKEVCEVTGLTESNVKIKLFRARKSLKGKLADTKNIY